MAVKVHTKPALMVSYVFLKKFEKEKHKYDIRNWSLDSGAFSAWKSGAKIDLLEYIDTCQRLLETDKNLTEIFALDVIAGGKGGLSKTKAAELSLTNTEKMHEAGVQAIPTYHVGEPESVLYYLAKTYPKIALGGMQPLRGKIKIDFIRECFARVWPKKIHGFALAHNETILMQFPFHSVDATTWELQPTAFGIWSAFGGKNLGIRGTDYSLRCEIEKFLKIERKVQSRWKKEMVLLSSSPTTNPDIKLVWFNLPKLMARSLGYNKKKGTTNE